MSAARAGSDADAALRASVHRRLLASDGAGYITGQTISVSGGLTMA